ncbi:hypothetical protein [Ferrimonas marina]|uniref:Uncharacterized protein n=1 Tax=Ferrimonas marina TaxID=299255 RepID=A0A1M5TND7_9GAMM|nr:hypothetical protein [Ferrimonas marina]SHH52224.1 hypothetical protein SAMN02745129_2214 [Ferrimonas marina]
MPLDYAPLTAALNRALIQAGHNDMLLDPASRICDVPTHRRQPCMWQSASTALTVEACLLEASADCGWGDEVDPMLAVNELERVGAVVVEVAACG